MITNQEFLKAVGMEMKVARVRKDWTRPQLSKESKVSVACIKQIENGEVDGHILNYKRIADTLEVDIKSFL